MIMKYFLHLFFFSFLFPTSSFAFIKDEAFYIKEKLPINHTCIRIKARYDKVLNDASKAMVDVYTSYSKLYSAKDDLSEATKDIPPAIEAAITNPDCLFPEDKRTCIAALRKLQLAYYDPADEDDDRDDTSISVLSRRMTKNATDAEARTDKFKEAIDKALEAANEAEEECL